MKAIIICLILLLISCNPNKRKFHNSNYTRKQQNGIYKYYTR